MGKINEGKHGEGKGSVGNVGEGKFGLAWTRMGKLRLVNKKGELRRVQHGGENPS